MKWTTEIAGPRKRSKLEGVQVDTAVGKATAVWIEAATIGAHYEWDPSSPRVLWTMAHFHEAVANMAVMNGLGYATPALQQHNHDGLIHGQVHDARIGGVEGAEILELLTSFRSAEDRTAYNNGQIHHFSPGVDWEAIHPTTGARLGVLIYELSFVSEPCQKTLKPPQETNPGVTLAPVRRRATKLEKTPMLSTQLNATIDALVSDDRSREDILKEIAAVLGMDMEQLQVEEDPDPDDAKLSGHEEEELAAAAAELKRLRGVEDGMESVISELMTKVRGLEDTNVRQRLAPFKLAAGEETKLLTLGRLQPELLEMYIERLELKAKPAPKSGGPKIQKILGGGGGGGGDTLSVKQLVEAAAEEGIKPRTARFVEFAHGRIDDEEQAKRLIKESRTFKLTA